MPRAAGSAAADARFKMKVKIEAVPVRRKPGPAHPLEVSMRTGRPDDHSAGLPLGDATRLKIRGGAEEPLGAAVVDAASIRKCGAIET